jgi:coenzyme F420 hydrogenase subunit beta
MVVARSAGVLQSGAPNDIVKALLVAARSANLIDGVLMLDMDPWDLTPTVCVASSVDEIVSGIGLQYLWAPVLESLNDAIFERGLSKLAVFGPPCVAQAARGLKNTVHERLWPYKQSMRLILSSFCTGIFMPDLIDDLLEKEKNIPRHKIQGITTSLADGLMTVTNWDGTVHQIPLTEVDPYTRRGCGKCDDFLGDQADISVGSVGSKEGYATLIVRTPIGETFLDNAAKFGLVETHDDVDHKAVDSARLEKDRRSVAKAYDAFQVLMLEALRDPKKQAVVRKQFVKLYGVPQAKGTREKSNVTCGGC